SSVEKSEGKKSKEAESRGITPHAAGLFRILIYTGARLGEILNLTWDAIRWEEKRLRLADSKTGQKTIELPAPAIRELERLRDIASPGCPWVIEGRLAGTRLQNATKAWQRIRK